MDVYKMSIADKMALMIFCDVEYTTFPLCVKTFPESNACPKSPRTR